MLIPYYEINLPLPPSVNAMHTVGGGFRNPKTGKMTRVQCRSEEYRNWIEYAAVCYRNAFPGGVGKLDGRLRVDYVFIWNKSDRGVHSSDVSNREKCLTDFLEGKFFENDKAIDEQHHYRRITDVGQNRVICRVYAIDDRRYYDPDLIFNPKKETTHVEQEKQI